MRKLNKSYKIYSCILICFLLILNGCARESDSLVEKQPLETQALDKKAQIEEPSTEEMQQTEELTMDEAQKRFAGPTVAEADWSNYFDGINGAAVIYDPIENCYQIYNQELAIARRSPCSTFKIISSLIALENGIIEPDDSTRTWSGEIFANEAWNTDIDFDDAFRSSCVWYFRAVIDEIGKDAIQEELNRLEYGNCDISDWSGQLNTNSNNPALTGFWIESSLLISPREQAEVMERIFGDHTDYSEETLDQLKQVMLLSEQSEDDISIYGKTGMGMSYNIVVDSWYTGFADVAGERIYFCVYLGETDNKDVSSAKAREIAIKMICNYSEACK